MSEEVVGSEVDTEEPAAVVPQPAPLLPGAILRAGREAQGLSVNDVTEILRFSRWQIEALERDDYQSLQGTTLVRGFVRSYAKLLKIAPEPLLAAINPEVLPSVADVHPPTNIGAAEVGRSVQFSLRRLSFALLTVILIVAGAWLYFLVIEPGVHQPWSSAPEEPAVTTPPTVVTPPAVNDSLKTESVGPDAPVAMPPSTALVFEFDDLSWVEVRDAAQKIVFVGEYPKGTRQVVDGQAPFQIWIGRASAVRLTHGDRSIDLKPFTREEVARLVVE